MFKASFADPNSLNDCNVHTLPNRSRLLLSHNERKRMSVSFNKREGERERERERERKRENCPLHIRRILVAAENAIERRKKKKTRAIKRT